MPLANPLLGNHFDLTISNNPGRPSASMGVAVNGSQATYSPYQNILAAASLTDDAYGIMVNINTSSVAGSARDLIVNIGASPPGAAGYSTIIPDLLGSCAANMSIGGGHWYYFPLFILSGTAIGAQANVRNTSPGVCYVYTQLFCRPMYPEAIKYGSYVYSVGAVSASSAGTIVTPGTTNEGAWTSLGSAASPAWWWQLGTGCNDATMNPLVYASDIGAGSPQDVIIADAITLTHGTSETMSKILHAPAVMTDVAQNVVIYGRMQCSGTADSNLSMIAYGLGG